MPAYCEKPTLEYFNIIVLPTAVEGKYEHGLSTALEDCDSYDVEEILDQREEEENIRKYGQFENRWR